MPGFQPLLESKYMTRGQLRSMCGTVGEILLAYRSYHSLGRPERAGLLAISAHAEYVSGHAVSSMPSWST